MCSTYLLLVSFMLVLLVVLSDPAFRTSCNNSSFETTEWTLRPAILSSEVASTFTGANEGSDKRSKASDPRISKADRDMDANRDSSAKTSSDNFSEVPSGR
jgi:hypothetical protein